MECTKSEHSPQLGGCFENKAVEFWADESGPLVVNSDKTKQSVHLKPHWSNKASKG